MWRFLALAVFLAMNSGGLAYSEVYQFPIPRGLNTDDDEQLLESGQTADAENVVTDEALGLYGRKGYTRFSTQTSNNLWAFPHSNGQKYLITQSSNNLMATTGSDNFTIFIGTVDSSVTTVASALGDRFYFMNRTDGLKYWDNSSVTVSTNGIRGNQLVTHKGRLWATGRTDDPRTIYISEYLNGDNWELKTNPTDTDPARIQVQGSLDESLTALFASFNDVLIWYKPNSFGGVYGSRRSNFISRTFSERIGTAYPESIKNADGELRWLGSSRVIYGFNGQEIKKLTIKNDTLMATVVQGDLNQRSWTQTTANDWNSGIVGALLDTTTVSGNIIFEAVSMPNDNFDDGDYTNNPTWNVLSGNYSVSGGTLISGGTPSDPRIEIENRVAVATYYLTLGVDPVITGGNSVFYFFQMPDETGSSDGYFLRLTTSGTAGIQYVIGKDKDNITVLISSIIPNLIENPIKIVRDFQNNIILYKGSTTFVGSANDSTYTTNRRFLIYPVSAQQGTAKLSELKIDASTDVFSSRFISNQFNVGTNITSWDSFNAENTLNNGSINYRLFVDSDSAIDVNNSSTFSSSQSLTSGQIPTISTGAFVTVVVDFSRTFSTYTTTLHDFSVRWNEGSTLRVASGYTNQRYWLGVAISSTGNNSVLVYDRNRNWQRYSGINMDASVIYNSNLYFGNANGIFQAESGYTDNGAAIASYWKTPSINLGFPNRIKFFDNFYAVTTNNDNTLQTEYYVDGVNSAFSLPNYTMTNESGYQDFRNPFPASQLNMGKTLSMKWTVSGNSRWGLLGGSLHFQPESEEVD